jgi:hypothetical protein
MDRAHFGYVFAQDGSVCIFDIRTSMCCHKLQCFGGQAVVSVLPAPGSSLSLLLILRLEFYAKEVIMRRLAVLIVNVAC